MPRTKKCKLGYAAKTHYRKHTKTSPKGKKFTIEERDGCSWIQFAISFYKEYKKMVDKDVRYKDSLVKASVAYKKMTKKQGLTRAGALKFIRAYLKK